MLGEPHTPRAEAGHEPRSPQHTQPQDGGTSLTSHLLRGDRWSRDTRPRPMARAGAAHGAGDGAAGGGKRRMWDAAPACHGQRCAGTRWEAERECCPRGTAKPVSPAGCLHAGPLQQLLLDRNTGVLHVQSPLQNSASQGVTFTNDRSLWMETIYSLLKTGV